MLPNVTARPYVQAREDLVRAFVRYYEAGGPTDASPLIKDHFRVHSSNGVPVEDMARLEVAISIAIISNTMPASFWLIYHIFSDPTVLEDCRKELLDGVTTHGGIHTINLTYIKNQCPIFLSTFQETFRIHSTSVASRVVLEDHILDGQYLLKKGGVILIPASVQHNLDSAWGSNVDKFYHKRFLQESRSKRYNPAAFRGKLVPCIPSFYKRPVANAVVRRGMDAQGVLPQASISSPGQSKQHLVAAPLCVQDGTLFLQRSWHLRPSSPCALTRNPIPGLGFPQRWTTRTRLHLSINQIMTYNSIFGHVTALTGL